ncbi:hypothetical protein ACWDS7_37640, partial [Streptosporangium sp. NPDC003464]
MLISLAAVPSWAQEPTPTQAPAETKTPHPSGTSSGDKVLDAAKSKAAKSGKRVEIPERNTETTTLYANPDGRTLRLELSTQPVRVKNADGKGFTPIDTTLVEEPRENPYLSSDGSVAHKNARKFARRPIDAPGV